mmetsp:Transcript_7723/g.14431  ORF Transcript_7723/g.14431 Transcript_7723/m.14431 type:complete len:233 (-) Transcript_7723:88-786(-)
MDSGRLQQAQKPSQETGPGADDWRLAKFDREPSHGEAMRIHWPTCQERRWPLRKWWTPIQAFRIPSSNALRRGDQRALYASCTSSSKLVSLVNPPLPAPPCICKANVTTIATLAHMWRFFDPMPIPNAQHSFFAHKAAVTHSSLPVADLRAAPTSGNCSQCASSMYSSPASMLSSPCNNASASWSYPSSSGPSKQLKHSTFTAADVRRVNKFALSTVAVRDRTGPDAKCRGS